MTTKQGTIDIMGQTYDKKGKTRVSVTKTGLHHVYAAIHNLDDTDIENVKVIITQIEEHTLKADGSVYKVKKIYVKVGCQDIQIVCFT